MAAILIYIIIIIIVVSIINSKKTAARPQEQPKQRQNLNAPIPVSQPSPIQDTQQIREWNLSQSLAAKKELEEKKSGMYSEEDKALIAKGKEQSTTDYLKQKAAQDEIGHRQEETIQRQRQQKFDSGNGVTTAERLIIGDSVPRDRRVLKCGYCGAENLVPVNMHSRYACYFCREVL